MLYEKLKNGTVLTHIDESPVEFLVDFSQKSREEQQPQKVGPQHYVPNEGKSFFTKYSKCYSEQRVYGTSHVILSQEEETRMQEINRIKNLSKETEATRVKQKVNLFFFAF